MSSRTFGFTRDCQIGTPDAAQPEQALALLGDATTPLDLLLTDMVMPGMSGRDLARRLREQRPGLRVLFMTGYSEELVTSASKLDGPLLQKPFTRESLLATVGAAVRANVTKGSPSPTT